MHIAGGHAPDPQPPGERGQRVVASAIVAGGWTLQLHVQPLRPERVEQSSGDATTASYEGGPGYKPEYSWKNNGLMVSQDPVALDYTGWQIIERKRAEKGLKTLEGDKRAPHYIATAADAQHRLGTNDPRRIAVVEV